MTDKHGPGLYTEEEARGRIPDLARRVALDSVNLVITLDRYPVESAEVERTLWAFSGEVGLLSKLIHTVLRAEGLRKFAEQSASKREPSKTKK
jgi:hypothetical protein